MTGQFAEYEAESTRVGMAHGVWGWFDDDLELIHDWGFELSDISRPVTIWQGAQDRMVPIAHGEWLAAHIPGARARLLPDQGHLSLALGHYGEVLDDLIASRQAAPAAPKNAHRVHDHHLVDLLLGHAGLEQRRQDLVRDQQVVGLLVGEGRIADEEVEEAGRVVGDVDPVGVALADERGQRPDPVGERVEVVDPEPVATEPRAGVRDSSAGSRGRCCRRRARSRSDPGRRRGG